jgi:hypothetical protein
MGGHPSRHALVSGPTWHGNTSDCPSRPDLPLVSGPTWNDIGERPDPARQRVRLPLSPSCFTFYPLAAHVYAKYGYNALYAPEGYDVLTSGRLAYHREDGSFCERKHAV